VKIWVYQQDTGYIYIVRSCISRYKYGYF